MICAIQVECLMEIFLNTFNINSLFSWLMSWIVHVSVAYTVYVRLCMYIHVLYMHVVLIHEHVYNVYIYIFAYTYRYCKYLCVCKRMCIHNVSCVCHVTQCNTVRCNVTSYLFVLYCSVLKCHVSSCNLKQRRYVALHYRVFIIL